MAATGKKRQEAATYTPHTDPTVQTAFTNSLAVKPSTLLAICKNAAVACVDDHAPPSKGAAISYYFAFSTTPLLIIVIAIAGDVFGEDTVRGALQGQIAGLVGSDGASAAALGR